MKSNPQSVYARPAEKRDLEAVVTIENEMWQGEGVELYTPDHFTTWMDINPAGFMVTVDPATEDVIAYGYFQTIFFDPKRIAEDFISCDHSTDHGFTRTTHKPNGNAFYGMSVVSRAKGGAGPLLMHVIQEAKRQKKDWYMGFPRINNYRAYREQLNKKLGPFAGHSEQENRLALSYALASAKMIGAKIWWNLLPPEPDPFPLTVEKPDQVLTAHLRHPDNGLGAILPGYMKDHASCDYSVMSLLKP